LIMMKAGWKNIALALVAIFPIFGCATLNPRGIVQHRGQPSILGSNLLYLNWIKLAILNMKLSLGQRNLEKCHLSAL